MCACVMYLRYVKIVFRLCNFFSIHYFFASVPNANQLQVGRGGGLQFRRIVSACVGRESNNYLNPKANQPQVRVEGWNTKSTVAPNL